MAACLNTRAGILFSGGHLILAVRSKRQTNFNLQPALRTVGRLHSSAVQTDSSLGDGETQPCSACLAAARIVDAIERPEKFVERILLNSRT